ncbi:MAG: hypothetical protein HFG37_07895 [Eubacterium sp.]|nr:hypothetical protein [Eubacterium sp.]
MDNTHDNKEIMERFMQENGLVFGIPEEFRDETPEGGMVVHEWDGGTINGTE